MEEEQQGGADLAVDAFGVKANIKNVKSLNTLATVATLIVSATLMYISLTHNIDAKDNNREVAQELKAANTAAAAAQKETNKELTDILKELARTAREQNCLLSFAQEKRVENAELCKRISK